MDQITHFGRAELDGPTPAAPASLRLFDHVLLGVHDEVLWRCETTHLLDQHGRLSCAVRLDIDPHAANVAGHFPSGIDRDHKVELGDLSVPTLEAAAHGLLERGTDSRAHYGTVMSELPLNHHSNMLGASLLTNCLPVTWVAKGFACQRVAESTGPQGVFFGATTLAASPTVLELTLAGYFPTYPLSDDARSAEDGLRYALRHAWSEVSIARMGQTVLWTAREPRRAG
ncbi:hypothetical protein F5X71_06100 [Nocardia brasiliensis]|uniref:Uncharacterized protein n=1 Tax=Nocardia brasiliensis TaxID=37326 RepID=A0A6G9XM01_NOCBR|nr:hypothetical protein [Nocardia brasiliensis]QIS01946.1 hypothetical protein F5X71_06100 [Nocardia brasiliensis]